MGARALHARSRHHLDNCPQTFRLFLTCPEATHCVNAAASVIAILLRDGREGLEGAKAHCDARMGPLGHVHFGWMSNSAYAHYMVALLVRKAGWPAERGPAKAIHESPPR